MKVGSFLLLIVLAAIVAVAALNWGELSASREVSLGVTSVQLPLGLVLLGLLVVLTALYFGFVVYLQAAAHLQSRRHARELQTSRKLAEEAEASRLADLKSSVFARIDRQESELRSAIEQSGNTLAAYIGELEDRLVKAGLAVK